MKCPKCGGETKVTRSIEVGQDDARSTKARTRRCLSCEHQFKTSEVLSGREAPWTAVMERMERMETALKEIDIKLGHVFAAIGAIQRDLETKR